MSTEYAVGEIIPGTGQWVTYPVTKPETTPTKATTAAPTTVVEPAETTVPVVTTTAAPETTAGVSTTAPDTETTQPETTETIAPVEPPETDPIETDPIYTDPVGGPYTVCFSNNLRWTDTVYAYCWNDMGGQNAEWPGEPMTYYDSNDYGEDRYTYEVSSEYSYIIFTNGTSKTVDIELPIQTDFGFYCLTTQNSEGAFDIATYSFI